MKFSKFKKILLCMTPIAVVSPLLLFTSGCESDGGFVVDTNFILDCINSPKKEATQIISYQDFFKTLNEEQRITELCYDLFNILNIEEIETQDGKKQSYMDIFLNQPNAISFQARISNFSFSINEKNELVASFLGFIKCNFLNDNFKNYKKGNYIQWTYDFDRINVVIGLDFSLKYEAKEGEGIIGIKRDSTSSSSRPIEIIDTIDYEPKNYFNVIK